MARKRRHEQHARLRLIDILLEVQERPERCCGKRLLGHFDMAVADANRRDAIGRARVRQPRTRNELAGRGKIPYPRAITVPGEWRHCASRACAKVRAGSAASE